jgi:hypothetical protein
MADESADEIAARWFRPRLFDLRRIYYGSDAGPKRERRPADGSPQPRGAQMSVGCAKAIQAIKGKMGG